ncbi:2-deoxy-D-gluconate 3-dehydrogenase [Parasitella parasitica]|nr:2-deoxy-D-gluconate 3-dehydrogenase [Parasitella parasitica]
MSKDLFSLDGKVAAISGCTRGIGRDMAVALAEAGADVCLLQRNTQDLSVYTEIIALGRQCHIVFLDANDQSSIQNCIPSVLSKFDGRLDILVNNAGIVKRKPAVDFLEEDWDSVMQCNLKSVFALSQAAGKHMIAQKSGKIINTASLMSYQGGLNVVSYAASKGGVATLTKALANEWAQFNVNVNAIAPGYIATDMTDALRNDKTRNHDILARIPAQRYGKSEDLKGPLVFLASQASNYVNGELLVVDGGWMGR